MGLFSFIKGAGKKVFGKRAPKPTEEEAKIAALTSAVTQLGIPVDGLKIDLAQQVIVDGATDTNADAYFADTMPRVSEQTVPLSMELI